MAKTSVFDRLSEWGFKVSVFKTVDSTSTRLLEDVRKGFADTGSVYVAERQTDGRGRLGRSFSSESGGLYMSFCTDGVAHGLSTVICAVAVAEALENFGFSPEIKWVNDILMGEKKVCGILAQSVGDGDRAVIGVGLNLLSRAIPEELSEIADGLDSFEGTVPEIYELCAEILIRYKTLSRSLPQGRESIISSYKNRMTTVGKTVTVLQTGECVRIVDVDNTGALIVQDSSGKLAALSSGEISIRKITTN